GDLLAMLRFGAPTVPAAGSVYALRVADRLYLVRGYSHAAAGEYSVALQLATIVFVVVRGFQYAWPPLAYSIEDDREAARLYALVSTYFLLAAGVVAAAVALLSRTVVRVLAAPAYFGAHAALGWLALGWTLYGLYLVMLVIIARSRATIRSLPAAAAGLALNVALLVLLVPRSGAGLGVSGELLLPGEGFAGIALRVLWLALIPVLLLLTRFFAPHELVQARSLAAAAWARTRRARDGELEAERAAELESELGEQLDR